ncbi:hypothetical protein NQ314_015307 [Rhamnusium bicolor]|uniref:Fanconi anemia group D2 protein n=1 Tax=Rhamnusium bicolor TaxID=1586634 RepID=A0AAV8X035_9CUCU|nr:hypothetical protein NQ314_015307 [Rhamnusium bicolor]
MSQRSSGILTSNKPTILKSQEIRAQIVAFKNGLSEAGVSLSFNEDPHTLTQAQALVVRDMEKYFTSPTECTEEFIKGLKCLCKKQSFFRKSLLPTRFKRNTDINETVGGNMQIQQECLFRILLKVNCLQKEVINILLDEITTFSSEETQDTSWLRLLLSPLRYLPYIKEAENLTTKLLDILDIATFPAQLEILDSVPEILPDSQYSETAKQLSKLLEENDELSAAIIDCLNALDLDSEIRSQVQDKILAKILTGTTLKIFPILLQFLMTDCKSQNLVATLFKVRNALDTIMLSSEKGKEKESSKILIFNRLQASAVSPKTIAEGWLNMISNIKVHSDHKPIDYLIFYIPQQLLKDYFGSIVEIGCSLLRISSGQMLVEFASTLFRTLFNHQHTETIYRREMLDSLIVLTGASDKKTVSCVLKIISSLLLDSSKLQQHTVLLMRLLEKLDTFELKDVKETFEILCTLTCGPRAEESLSGLKDEIHMIVLVMAKHIAFRLEEQDVSFTEHSIITISMLPQGPAREAANLLDLTSMCTSGCPELMGLYYDQLTLMLMDTEHLDKYFMAWLHETITTEFESIYVTQKAPDSINDLQFSMQYLLNSPEEMDPPLSVNIAGLSIECEHSMILLLAPHFRLLRLIHYRQQAGDLSTINALLGCAVILPEVQEIEDLDTDQVRQVADCLFHCVNWFREVISGFVLQKNRKIRAKVVHRLQNMIEVEKKLLACMEKAPDHKLPVSYFDSVSEVNKQITSPVKQDKIKNPKKKFKSAAVVNDADETIASTAATSQAKRKKSIVKVAVKELHITFREIDTDVILLLKYPLKLDDDDETQQLTQTAALNIDQLIFLLKDYVSKLDILTQGKNIGLSHLNVVVPSTIISDSTLLLEATDGRHDLPQMFTEYAIHIKTCFGLVLEVFYLIFNWAGFQQSRNLDLLKTLLKSIRPGQSQTLNSANRLITEFIKRLAGYHEQCLEISHGVSLVRTMEALYSATVPSPEIDKKIVSVAEKLLQKRWYNSKGNLDAGKNFNANIDVLLKAYLKGASIKVLCGLVGTLMEQAQTLTSKEDCLPMLVSIDKQNFHIFYMCLCNSLLDRVKTEVQSLTNSQHLILWRTTVTIMHGLMTVAKAQENKTNLVCFLKKSIGILNVFLSHGIPILEIMLRSKPDEVIEIFKTLQTNTRFLHHLCCYSKLTKDASLMAFVPKFRLTLETIIYRVKAALVANNCSKAFWLGNLRNRDLQGDDILSQSTVVSEDNEQNSDEELPADDSDEEMLNDDNASSRSQESEVFD